jgi:hypothetical protein
LKNVVFDKKVGFMTPEKPDMFIKETWRFTIAMPDYPDVDFAFLNFKPGGISDAKAWVNAMYTRFKKGEDVLTLIWEANTYSKDSNTSNSSSYQIEGSKIKVVGYVEQAQYEKAVRIRDQIKKSQASLFGADGDY